MATEFPPLVLCFSFTLGSVHFDTMKNSTFVKYKAQPTRGSNFVRVATNGIHAPCKRYAFHRKIGISKISLNTRNEWLCFIPSPSVQFLFCACWRFFVSWSGDFANILQFSITYFRNGRAVAAN